MLVERSLRSGRQGLEQDYGFYKPQQREEYVLPLYCIFSKPANTFTVEFATVGRTKEGTVYHHLWGAEEIDALLKEHGLTKPVSSEDASEPAAQTTIS